MIRNLQINTERALELVKGLHKLGTKVSMDDFGSGYSSLNLLSITSLCEGVETPEQSDYLKEVGCQIQQGFYFSRPIPQKDFEEFMDQKK